MIIIFEWKQAQGGNFIQTQTENWWTCEKKCRHIVNSWIQKHLSLPTWTVASVFVEIQSGMLHGFIFLTLLHLSSALFEECDEAFKLETDASLTISSESTLKVKNTSSCRLTLVAPVNYIIDITCTLVIDQPDSQWCPLKRFFLSVDGVSDLRGADYFCSRNGTKRTVRRKSIMNRLVLAYVTQVDVEQESFECVAKRIESDCDCGWSRKVWESLY